MQLRNHIAYRFLKDEALAQHLLKIIYPVEWHNTITIGPNKMDPEEVSRMGTTGLLLYPEGSLNYYVTDSILDKLPMMKISSINWSVFKDLDEDKKYTMIFRRGTLLRFTTMRAIAETEREKPGDMIISFFHLDGGTKDKPNFCRFYINTETNAFIVVEPDTQTEEALREAEEFCYSLLCFFFLAENEEIIVQPGRFHSTKKQADALVNDSSMPVTIVNSNWNITSIRNEGFDVRGFFRVQPYGPGRAQTRLQFIHPFKKHGYIRKATKPE